MKKTWIQSILGAFFLLSLAFWGVGCGGCAEGETEVCSNFMALEKNGEVVDNCVCVAEECSVDEDCGAGFVCQDGLCVAN